MLVKNSGGFSILELSLYVALVVIVIPLIFSFFNKTQNAILKNISFQEQIIRNAVVIDLLKRELMSAKTSQEDWDIQQNIFRKESINTKGYIIQTWVGWKITKKGLIRRAGVYDPNVHKWIKKNDTLFICSIKKLTFFPKSLEEKQEITGITVQYQDSFDKNSKTNEEFIRLRNRKFLWVKE
jgi:hypothetical protein